MKTILRVKGLKKSYGDVKVLAGVDLELNKGEIKCIIGGSGSGKTTILRCLGLLDDFDEGEIIFEDDKVTSESKENDKKKIRDKQGVEFQDFNLWPHKTVLENIMEPLLLIKKVSKKEAKEKGLSMLKKVGLKEKADVYPDFLSGGQRQRAAIARTLAMKPSILFLDEITSALDPELVGGILKLIKRLAREGQTMLLVTHHVRFASEIADTILFIDKGRIIEEGSPRSIIYGAKEVRTREFLKTLTTHDQEINVYEGYEDFKAFLIGLLKRVKPGTIGYVLGAAGDRWYDCIGDAIDEYEKIRNEKNIKWKMVIYKLSAKERKTLDKLKDMTEYRLIPKELNVPGNINIWGDTILLQTFGDPPTIIEIKNKALAQTYLNYFRLLWERGKEVS